jgi:hypothetical protein
VTLPRHEDSDRRACPYDMLAQKQVTANAAC